VRGRKWGKRKEKKEKKRKRDRGKGKGDTCPILGGWDEIMLSPPSQLCTDTWQGEISLCLKLPTFINYHRTPTLYYLYHL
jgi:hypothetical protein